MQTSFWGPPAWKFLFCVAANYPEKIDKTNRLHVSKMKQYKEYFRTTGDILPCKYCRRSYKKFIKELPIDKYLGSRQAIMYWLYLIKDKVNKKLIAQGLKVKPSPPFEQICKHYESMRASCSNKTKTCSKPKL